jgi:hypothetical protein
VEGWYSGGYLSEGKNEDLDGAAAAAAAAKTISLLQQPRRSREGRGNEETERKGITIKKKASMKLKKTTSTV